MCQGDTTFEILTNVGVNGMGATHKCRDFDSIFAWAYAHRSDKAHGTGFINPDSITHTPAKMNDFDEVGNGGHGHGGHGGH